jgi:hypothetical protein
MDASKKEYFGLYRSSKEAMKPLVVRRVKLQFTLYGSDYT